MTAASAEKRALRNKRASEEEEVIGGASSKSAAKKRRSSQELLRPAEKTEIDEVEVVEITKGRGKRGSAQNKKSTSGGSKKSTSKGSKEEDVVPDVVFEEEIEEGEEEGEEEEVKEVDRESVSTLKKRKGLTGKKSKKKDDEEDSDSDCCFLGDPVPDDEAKQRWPERYQKKNAGRRSSITKSGEDDDVVKARCHYLQARVDGCVYDLYDNAYVKGEEGKANFIGRILEFFETCDHQLYFTTQWFYRAEDTVIKEHAHSHDARRVFLSEDKDDNVLDCIVSKIRIVQMAPNIDLPAKEDSIPPCDLYYDMSYSNAYSTFANLPSEIRRAGSETSSTISSDNAPNLSKGKSESDSAASTSGQRSELSLLDLYSGCGAMSTGLCLGANLSGVNLQTRWAVDLNPHACESLKLNHPKTEVRNEQAQDFLALLREWDNLCRRFGLEKENLPQDTDSSDDEEESKDMSKVPSGEFEVGKLVGICYGKTSNLEEVGLKFKVRWKGYGPSDDTWEPFDGLSKCQERIKDFVRHGYKKNILPLPGRVDVICGGPPCQGISGFNRFRNSEAPLEDQKNQQMVVFMDIVDFLKPKFVLMENVVDILKFAGGFLGRYALSRLVAMNYQARLGIMAAGCYGLPQFRMRVFLWGARPSEKLPQFPLPTHDVVVRGGHPTEFEQNVVAFGENQERQLEKALLLGDAISDLPPVANDEGRDEMGYGRPSKTDFQSFIRLTREELMNPSSVEKQSQKGKLFDHRPLQLNEDDYLRVCQIPKRKGANFRDLPGVVVGPDNIVEWDPSIERVKLPSGKPLVPDYAMSFIKGKSSKPFGRLWWDETIATVVTRAEPHNQIVLHPEQDRVLTIRENARLQGFPDYYKLCGPVKGRYIQVGNAVAIPVSRALGYALGLTVQGKCSEQPIFTLPPKFPQHQLAASLPVEADVIE